MKIYIQSKSGNYNMIVEIEADNLKLALAYLSGGYHCEKGDGRKLFIPFSEIEYIQEHK